MKGIRRILIINGKGGCGKTTIATNLAVAYAQQGKSTALLDYDSQASSTDWSELRQQHGSSNRDQSSPLAKLRVIPTHKRVGMYQTRAFSHQLASDVERIVIDTPSGARERDIDTLIKQCDVILVPMLSSPLDIRSGSRFVAELLTHRAFRANPRPIGVIANRLQNHLLDSSDQKHLELPEFEFSEQRAQRNAANQQKLMHALECLDVPCVANFADSDLYGYAAEEGMGITELAVTSQASVAEQTRWFDLVSWVEAQPKRAQRLSPPARAASKPADNRSGASSSLQGEVRDGERADGATA